VYFFLLSTSKLPSQSTLCQVAEIINFKKGKVYFGFGGFSSWSVGSVIRLSIMAGLHGKKVNPPHGRWEVKKRERGRYQHPTIPLRACPSDLKHLTRLHS
jgi:hypothetical protein